MAVNRRLSLVDDSMANWLAAQAIVSTGEGKRLMDDMRTIVGRMEAREEGLLAVRNAESLGKLSRRPGDWDCHDRAGADSPGAALRGLAASARTAGARSRPPNACGSRCTASATRSSRQTTGDGFSA